MIWPADYLRVGLFLFNGTLIAIVTRSLKAARAQAGAAAKEQELAKREAESAIRDLESERSLREQFVATLTHDLRGPLTAVKTSAQMLIRHPEKAEIRDRHSQRIIQGTERADRMIENLLDVSRIRGGQSLPISLDYCELHAMVADVIEELRLTYSDRFVIKGEQKLSGYWDCNSMRRILENLLSNAAKYGCQKTAVTVALSRKNGTAEIDVHNAIAEGGEALSPEELVSMFEPYRRSKQAEASGKHGWGLGLTLVKGITEAHGGTVEAKSTAANGTDVIVRIPVDARPKVST